ncbi:MAG TPA: hypothetical protein VE196_05185 [Pseudonocardiaceae bacterium]|nr:hypothetical protein [Pseudonocardiaceae bacterium]
MVAVQRMPPALAGSGALVTGGRRGIGRLVRWPWPAPVLRRV